MKTTLLFSSSMTCLAAGVMLSCVAPVMAQEKNTADKAESADAQKTDGAAEEKTVSATGSVFSVEPEMLSVVMEGNPTPVRFAYDKATPYLDDNGSAVSMDLIRPELPLTVHYVTEGEKLIAKKVVITRSMIAGDGAEAPGKKRAELAKAKAREVEKEVESEVNGPQSVTGTIATVEQTISLVPRGEKKPRSYVINNSTRYVNISGEPVSSAMVLSGMPVTVKAIADGTRLIAQEVTVRGDASNLMNGQGGIDGTGTSTSGGNAEGGNSTGTSGTSTRTTRSNRQGGSDYLPLQGVSNPGILPQIGQQTQPGNGDGNMPANGIPNGANGNNTTNSNNPNGNGSANGNGNANNNGNANANNPNGNGTNNNNSNADRNGTNQPNQPSRDNQPNPDNKPAPANPSPSTGSGSGTSSGSGSTGGQGGSTSGGSGGTGGTSGTGSGGTSGSGGGAAPAK